MNIKSKINIMRKRLPQLESFKSREKIEKTRSRCFIATAIMVLFLSCLSGLQAQGRLMGQVLGTDGNPVSGATVFISGQQATQAKISNAQGYYVFLSVPEGTYEVKATRRGMPNWKSSVQVQSAQTHRIDMKLGESPAGVVSNAVAVSTPSVSERKSEEPKSALAPQVKDKPQKEEKPVLTAPSPNQVASTLPPPPVITTPPQPKPVDAELQRAVDQAQKEAETLTQMESGAASMDSQVDIIGGMTAVYKNITYPRDAERTGIQGQVIVRVYVSPQGNISRLDVMKSPSKLLSDEVIRVLTEEVQFTPATSAGKPVIGIMTIPISFKLKQ